MPHVPLGAALLDPACMNAWRDFNDAATLPDDAGNTAKQLVCKGTLEYHPYFGPMMAKFFGGDASDYIMIIKESKMKMKNVAEIALVLDNSGSMAWDKYGNNASTANQRIFAA